MPASEHFQLTPREIKQLESLRSNSIFPDNKNKQNLLELRVATLLRFRYPTPVREVAKALNVPVRSVYHWRTRYREAGLGFITNIPTGPPKRLHDPNRSCRLDPNKIRADVEALIKRQGTNRFSMNTLSYLLRVSTASLKRYRSAWRDLIQSPQPWKVKQ